MNLSFPQYDEVRLYIVDLRVDASDYLRLRNSLSTDETHRADRFLIEDVRRRFVVCRGVLREILAGMTDSQAGKIRFRYEQWGKPQLASAAQPPRVPVEQVALHFNVSHSADTALIAVATSPVGVDLEVLDARAPINFRAIASQVVSPIEEASWQVLKASERDEQLMRLWVCKEALLKAMGLGIAEGLKQVSFPLPITSSQRFMPRHIDAALQLHVDDDGTCSTNSWTDALTWRMQVLEIAPNTVAATATQRGVNKLTQYEIDLPFLLR
ncbi:MAG: 4'-phosphopantetheinyl transferase superfamily protein [Pirellulaceae bacterium]